jgi:hypothetical protein
MSNKKLYTLYKSSSQKKYEVYIENPNTDRINKISFGAKNYSDYTLHKDPERKQRYIDIHKKKQRLDIKRNQDTGLLCKTCTLE